VRTIIVAALDLVIRRRLRSHVFIEALETRFAALSKTLAVANCNPAGAVIFVYRQRPATRKHVSPRPIFRGVFPAASVLMRDIISRQF
jgi:hypothetical protein